MSEARFWFAPVAERPDGAWAVAEAHTAEGAAAGWLTVWKRSSKPVRDAMPADPRAFDPDGEPAWVSLVWVPRDLRVLFDDPAVQHARQRALAASDAAALSTFPRDASTFGGALSGWRGARAAAQAAEDPFARVSDARVLRVGPGLLGRHGLLPGPVIERYGGQPWPADRFPS